MKLLDYKMVVDSFDWGPGVTSLIVQVEEPVESLKKKDFDVTVLTKKNDLEKFEVVEATEVCPVLSVSFCDVTGLTLEESSSYIKIDLEVHPDYGNPFFFFFNMKENKMGNMWSDVYEHTIKYKENTFKPQNLGTIIPVLEEMNLDNIFTGSDGHSLQYASYEPDDEDIHPVLIWLHGMGEGSLGHTVGTEIAMLGNRVTQLISPDVQDIFGGAYVLVPQTESFWLNDGSGDVRANQGRSLYETVLIELIEDYLDAHPGTDRNRVYIGGCSNGGFMTVRTLLNRPDLFAAAWPVCMYFSPDYMSDEEIEKAKAVPTWITHDILDPTVPYAHSKAFYERMKEAGANVVLTATDGIYDTTGQYFDDEGRPYAYNLHLSWIPVLNNEISTNFDGEDWTIFEWLSQQVRASEEITDTVAV